MYNSRIQYAMDNFIEEHYFLPMQNTYKLREIAESGKSILILDVDGENICVSEYDNKKRCNFLRLDKIYGMQKCIDHFILKKSGDIWDLYMIEMKSGVGDKKWLDIKSKMRSSLLNIKALCEFMGITVGGVYAYTTYERECFEEPFSTADIKAQVPLLGEKASSFKYDEWYKDIIKIKIDDTVILPHKAIKMERNGENELEGRLHI